jgi:hypothetical protein
MDGISKGTTGDSKERLSGRGKWPEQDHERTLNSQGLPTHIHTFQILTPPVSSFIPYEGVKKRRRKIRKIVLEIVSGHGTEGVATHNQSGISFGVDFSLFTVDDLLHALLLIHSSSFRAVRPLVMWMLIYS